MISNIAPGYAGMGYAPRLIDAKLYSQIPEEDGRKNGSTDRREIKINRQQQRNYHTQTLNSDM